MGYYILFWELREWVTIYSFGNLESGLLYTLLGTYRVGYYILFWELREWVTIYSFGNLESGLLYTLLGT